MTRNKSNFNAPVEMTFVDITSENLLEKRKDKYGNNVLHIVCANGSLMDSIRLANLYPELIGQINNFGHTPLYELQHSPNLKNSKNKVLLINKFNTIELIKNIAINSKEFTNVTPELLEESLRSKYKTSPFIYAEALGESDLDSEVLGESDSENSFTDYCNLI